MLVQILLLVSLFFLVYYKSRRNLPKNLPPGPWILPIFGTLLQTIFHTKRGSSFDMFHSLTETYGSITFLKIGVLYLVLTEDYNIAKEVLADDLWVDRHLSSWIAKSRSYGKHLGILITGGRSWKEMRRFSMRTLRDFGFGRQTMEIELTQELTEFISRLESDIGQGKVIRMTELFSSSVLNVLWSMIAGQRFCHDDEKLSELLQIIENEVKMNPLDDLTSPMFFYSAFPFMEKVVPLFSSQLNRIKKNYERLHNFFQQTLNERRAEGLYQTEQRDYIDVFLRKIDIHRGDDPETNLYTDEQFVVTAMDLFMAGSDTTNNTLEFAMFFLTKNPKVQEKIQEEIDTVVGLNRLPTYSDRLKMLYTEATILEVHRQGSVLPITIRSPTKETTLSGYTIPATSAAMINLRAIHMNKEVWGDPLTFRPERFLSDDLKIINADKILPFGAGKRACMGEQLARVTVFTYVTTLLQQFTFIESPSHLLPSNEPEVGFTLSPQPFLALVKPRQLK